MSLQPTWNEEIPEETLALGQKLLDEDDVYRLVGDEVQEVLQAEDFAQMYSILGRGAIHPIVLALVIVSRGQRSISNVWHGPWLYENKAKKHWQQVVKEL